MANPCSYNCADLPDHELLACAESVTPGISGWAWLACDHAITDFTSEAQWNTAITAGNAKIIGDGAEDNLISAEYTSSVVEVDNPSAKGPKTRFVKLEHSFTFTDANVSATNDTFYESLNKTAGLLVWYNFEEDQIRVVTETVNFQVLPADSVKGEDFEKYMGTAKWVSDPDEFPDLYSAPPNIFD
jgi:hypothetical protein